MESPSKASSAKEKANTSHRIPPDWGEPTPRSARITLVIAGEGTWNRLTDRQILIPRSEKAHDPKSPVSRSSVSSLTTLEVFAPETLLDDILWPNSCAPPWLLNILMFFIIR